MSSLDPRHRSNYSPSAEPPPLHTQIPLASGPTTATPTANPITPRIDNSSGLPARPPSAGSTSSNPRIIRPADIYRRMAEEREKERRSLDQQRPTSEALAGRSSMESAGAVGSGNGPTTERSSIDSVGSNRPYMKPALSPLPERKDENRLSGSNMLPSQSSSTSAMPSKKPVVNRTGTNPPQLPDVGGDATFGDEFWESTPLSGRSEVVPEPVAADSEPAVAEQGTTSTSLQHHPSVGLTSMVHQAFDKSVKDPVDGVSKQDSTRSVTNSSFSRSDTTHTSDISPIVSRNPSSTTGAAKSKAADPRVKTPAIEEEPSTATATRSRAMAADSLAAVRQVRRKPSPSPGHSRQASAEVIPGYRRDLNTPSPNNSPARTPYVEETKQLPAPEVAHLAMNDPVETASAKTLPQPYDAATREADLAEIARAAPEKRLPAVGAAEQLSQEAFLERKPSLPNERATVIKREESPSKGRVADLAGRFNATSNSRKGSVDAWEEPSSPASEHEFGATTAASRDVEPVAELAPPTRPTAERDYSFRPKLPGQWESFRTDAPQEERSTPPSVSHYASTDDGNENVAQKPSAATTQASKPSSSPLTALNPLASLAAAGAAMGEAFKKSAGLGSNEEEPKSPSSRSHGDVLHRPVISQRMDTDTSTSVPTPPEKDDWERSDEEEEDIPPPVPLKERGKSPETSTSAAVIAAVVPKPFAAPPQLSSEESGDDLESDRLRKEIVRSLSPLDSTFPAVTNTLDAHSAVEQGESSSQRNSLIPNEYESYWNEKETVPAERLSNELPEVVSSTVTAKPEPPKATNAALPTAPAAAKPRPTSGTPAFAGAQFLTNRFSWEPDDPMMAAQASDDENPRAAAAAKSKQHAEADLPPVPATGGASAEARQLAIDNPRFSGEGLHVINAEPGEIPLPPVRELSPAPVETEPPAPAPQPLTPTSPSRFVSTASPGSYELGGDPGLPAFRDIVADKSQQQRITKFTSTRDSWVNFDMGVGTWLDHVLETDPEHRHLASEPLGGAGGPTGPRHKQTTSITRVFTGAKGIPGPQTGTGEPVYIGQSQGSAGSTPHRQAAVQGKEILQAASVLGGKGMKGAKGLFAKGKSKLRGSGAHEKVDD